MTERRWEELAAAYALDALEPDERRAFEDRLAEDEELRETVREYREVLGDVAEELEPATPPDGLKERILARARAERPSAAGASDGAPAESEAGPSPSEEGFSTPSGRAGPGSGEGRPPARASAWLPRLAAAALLVISVGLGTYALQLRERATGLEERVAALRAELAESESALARLDTIADALRGADVRFAALSAPDAQPRLHLIWNQEQELVVVAGSDLEPVSEDRTYQLWGIREGEDPVSLGTFEPDADGSVVRTVSVEADRAFDLGAVTEEPAGGSPQPTSTPFLLGEWSPGRS